MYDPATDAPTPDWEAYSAYKKALAIDIKRYYGNDARIFIRNGDEFLEITGIPSAMFRHAT